LSQAQLHSPPGSVIAELTEIVRSVLDEPGITLTEHTTAQDVPGWDSMTHIAIIVEAECRFGISFAATEIGCLQCVVDLARLIQSKCAAAAA
jgi:acyl carrier protein